MPLVVVELLVSGSDVQRDLLRERIRVEDAWGVDAGGKSVGAIVEHELGEVLGGGLDAEVTEHGIGFPTAEELNVVLVNACTEEGSGASGTEGAGADEVGVDASDRL